MMALVTRKKTYDLSERTHIMGILNVTPDSFSDGGNYNTLERAVSQALEMERLGADIIDIGGESTRPGHTPVSIDEEIARVVPIIEAVNAAIDIPISIDTYKAETARKAMEAGADIINDIWGAKQDPEIAYVAADFNAPIILMHNRDNMNYSELMDDMLTDLEESINIALEAGVSRDNIILDPGIGFAKTVENNLFVLNHLEKLTAGDYPVLLGTSRKRFIGDILNVSAQERDIGTGATTCLGIAKGAKIIRVHNVAVNVQLARMTDAMLRSK